MKICQIVGARPQFIKLAMISNELKKHKNITEVIIHTGQHFDQNMSQIFFDEMNIPKPKYNLDINSIDHCDMIGKMIIEIGNVLKHERPDIVTVYGDTNSTLAGAIAARKLNIKIAHIEAGLRSGNMEMPEESNRIITDIISNYLFCPTDLAFMNLKNEGHKNIFNFGDVMYDAILFYSKKQNNKYYSEKGNNKIICTIHREANCEIDKLNLIIKALNEINKDVPIVLYAHPRINKIIIAKKISCEFSIYEPIGYLEMISNIKNCFMVMTDSGGLQKEAYLLKKKCLILRDETEWSENIYHGCSRLVGNKTKKIIDGFNELKNIESLFSDCYYGYGNASELIVKELNKGNK